MKRVVFLDDLECEHIIVKENLEPLITSDWQFFTSAVSAYTEVDWESVDILITDLLMPILTGPELAVKAKAKNNALIVIARTNVIDEKSDYNCDYTINKNDDDHLRQLLCKLLST